MFCSLWLFSVMGKRREKCWEQTSGLLFWKERNYLLLTEEVGFVSSEERGVIFSASLLFVLQPTLMFSRIKCETGGPSFTMLILLLVLWSQPEQHLQLWTTWKSISQRSTDVYSWHSSDVEEKAVYITVFFNYFCHFTSHFNSGFVFCLPRKKKTNKTIVEVHYKEKWNVTNNYLNTPTRGTSLGTHIQTHTRRKTISVSSLKFRTFDENVQWWED